MTLPSSLSKENESVPPAVAGGSQAKPASNPPATAGGTDRALSLSALTLCWASNYNSWRLLLNKSGLLSIMVVSGFMRHKFFALSLIIFASAATLAAGAQTEAWTKFSSPEGRFSILMPTEPLSDEQKKETPVGEVVMHFLTSRSGTGIFIAAYADYAMGDAKRELDANRDSFLKGMKATLVSESDIKLRENPGREIKATRDGLSIRSRIFLVGRRYYQAVAITPASLPGDVEADKFLTSFELLPSTTKAVK